MFVSGRESERVSDGDVTVILAPPSPCTSPAESPAMPPPPLPEASASSRGFMPILPPSPPRPKASAPSRGLPSDELRIGSWNLGVPDSKSNMSKGQKPFAHHLASTLPFAVDLHKLNVVVLQEVNQYWANHAHSCMPGWQMAWEDKKAILVEEKTWRLVETDAPLIFPGASEKTRRGRRVQCVPSLVLSRVGSW